MNHFEYLEKVTRNILHGGRPFYNHLVGTHDLLKKWHKPDYVCLAGLYHSIYGTHYFRQAAVPLTARTVIRDMIGQEAEALAYLFCTSPDRLHSFRAMPEPVRSCLLDIEAANLLEQRAHRAKSLGVQ